jgi:hypothetical protein
MSKKIIKNYITLIIVFFSWIHFANAGFEITEIMYDLDGTDTNREWVEVKNTGSNPEDLSKWYLFSDNTKHALVPQSESMVPSGAYAVIAQNVSNFRSDWPNFGGLLFDSSWTGFSNDGESIGLKDPDLNVVSPITFTSSQGGAGDGNSLSKINGSWFGATPTPGADNVGGSSGGGGGDNVGTIPTTASTTSTPKKKEVEIPKIITNIVAKNTAVAGIPLLIDNTTLGYGKEPLRMGRFVWNFGDGTTKIEYEHFPFSHVYQYSGDYVITLSYYRVNTSTTLEATDRLAVKVIPSEVYISSVGDEANPYVELQNKGNIEINLSGWYIQGATRRFYIPEGTIILANNKLKFSPEALQFTGRDMHSVILYNESGENFSTYPKVNTVKYSTLKANTIKVIEDSASTNSSVINLDDLGASAGNSSASIPTSTLAWFGLAGILIIGSISVFLIHKRNNKNEYIGDEVIRASDMTIVE